MQAFYEIMIILSIFYASASEIFINFCNLMVVLASFIGFLVYYIIRLTESFFPSMKV